MPRPIKLTFLGAGSIFTPRLVSDILSIPGGRGGTLALVDFDPRPLLTMQQLINRLADKLGKSRWRILTSTDRREVLKGCDYAINCIEVNGRACVRPN